MSLIEAKRAMRAAMRLRRSGLSEAERQVSAATLPALMRRECPIMPPAVVSAFWPINDEIDIRPLMLELVGQGCKLALPVVQGQGTRLLFRSWQPNDPLEAGVFGTMQPATRQQTIEPDVLLVPLLACDAEGWRLGYGGGFYDRTLESLRAERNVIAVGVGFDAQRVPSVPHGPGDQRLDWLLTDRRACAFV